MAQIAIWLVRQMNAYGGFRSTQDTVVAIEALAAYGLLIFKPNANHNVVIKSGNGQVGQLTLNQTNRLLVQRQPLPAVPGQYAIDVSGTGCCLVQSTVQFNIPVPKDNSAFSVSVTSSGNCLNGVAFVIGLTVTLRFPARQLSSL
ncbi:hypothetical protein XENTR_v10017659 [Xenopus tropicalis]|nr:hypothetical protein XENTR_v10017659 [Xenopus tropicalis]